MEGTLEEGNWLGSTFLALSCFVLTSCGEVGESGCENKLYFSIRFTFGDFNPINNSVLMYFIKSQREANVRKF